MAQSLNFDTNRLDALLDKWGKSQTWVNLLATHVAGKGSRFEYMLVENFLAKHEILEVDVLEGLSIGEMGVLYEYSAAYVNRENRKNLGQFFTPDDVAIFMANQTKGFRTGVWLDPCSGIGNLSWHLVNAQKNKEEFLRNNLILSDLDSLALEIARVLFTLSFQVGASTLYNEIKDRFKVFDFLSVADKGADTLIESAELRKIPVHDFVLVNPPYLGLRAEDSRFESAKAKDLYAYFLENIIKTSEGFVSVTPQSFTNAEKFRPIRSLLLKQFSNLKIYCFDNIPGNIFSGIKFGSENSNKANSIRVSITVASNAGIARKITSLLRWKTAERSLMFANVDKFLTEIALEADFFPKVSAPFASLYKSISSIPTLGDLISNKPTDHVLYVPAAPRYFISALKTAVARASLKTLYFRNQDDLNYAYILINSSLMYWWWRVRDGGMTLSLESIKSMPAPAFKPKVDLVKELEKSEIDNRVYKMNAGAIQENVKHTPEIQRRLNQAVLPEFADLLALTHLNSDLGQVESAGKAA